jgi:uncharacterized protein
MACVNRLRLLATAISFLILLTGCQIKKPVLPVLMDSAQEVQADAAWQNNDYAQSEQLYRELLVTGQIPGSRQDTAWERLIQSALRAGHTAAALEDLRRWSQLRPGARADWPFHQAHLETFLALDEPGLAKRHLATTLSDPRLPREVRMTSGRALASLHWEHKELDAALSVLATTYPLCPWGTCREEMESELLAKLSALEPQLFGLLEYDTSIPESKYRFPGLQLLWQRHIAEVREHPERWTTAWPVLEQLLEKGRWEDALTPRMTLSHLVARFGTPRESGIALLIPLSGPYAQVGWKVAAGAEMARQQLGAMGADLNIRVINSDSENWAEQLRALPQGYSYVGGPLQSHIMQEAVGMGLTELKPFFTFMPSLNEISEGSQAWRFFGGPDDQVHSLLRWTTENLEISTYAVLYPDERFGLGMSKFFWQRTTQMGGKVTALKSYPPQESKGWAGIVEALLTPPAPIEAKGTNRPDPDYQAVFLPDTLTNAKSLVPQFHFYDESRLVFLGTELWTQNWNEDSSAESRYFQLALMPGAWWAANPAPAARELGQLSAQRGESPDFWTALGYDFARFAAFIGPLAPDWSPRDVNRLLAQTPGFSWSLAPLQWNLGGIVTQEMFVLTPGGRGLVLAEPQRFREVFEQAQRRHLERQEAGKTGESHMKTGVPEQVAQ